MYMDDLQKQIKIFNEMIKSIPFLAYVNGRVRSGKSSLIKEFIKYITKLKAFDEVGIAGSQIDSHEWIACGIPQRNILDKLTTEHLEKIKEIQLSKPKTRRKNVLLVIDDALESCNTRGTEFVQTLSILRHLNVTIIILTQHITGVHPIVRTNAYYAFLFSIIGQRNLQTLHQQLSDGKTFYEFVQDFIKSTNDHHCIYINNTLDPTDKKYKIHFRPVITDKKKTQQKIKQLEHKEEREYQAKQRQIHDDIKMRPILI